MKCNGCGALLEWTTDGWYCPFCDDYDDFEGDIDKHD